MTTGLIDEDMPEKYVIWLIKKYKLEKFEQIMQNAGLSLKNIFGL